MSNHDQKQQQDQNTGELVMNTFFKVAHKEGVTAADIAKYLQDKFGDIWRVSTLVGKAEETLKRSVNLGFLDKRGDRYVANIARELRCGQRKRSRRRSRSRKRSRRRSRCRKRSRRRSRCRRRRRRSRSRRRRRRRSSCRPRRKRKCGRQRRRKRSCSR